MKIISKYTQTIIVSSLFWCLLNESFSLATVIQGIVIALVTVFTVHYLFWNKKYISYRINIISLIKYILLLFINIYVSAIKVCYIILKYNDRPTVIKIKTKVKDDWLRCLVSNAITLTPGTVTLDKTDNTLTVLWLNPTTTNVDDAAKIIQGDFEHALIRKEK